MSELSRNVAVFIDAENTGAPLAAAIVEQAAALGRVAFIRVYGKPAQLSSWDAAMKAHAIVAMPTPAAASKKNASDFALTIDAVKALHETRFDHALLVSMDGDFLQLVLHLKAHGARVTGAGGAKAAAALRKVCDGWITLTAASPVKAAAKPPPPAPAKPKSNKAVAKPIDTERLTRTFSEFAQRHPNGVHRDTFIRHIAIKMPKARKGHGTWMKFLAAAGVFDIDEATATVKLKSA
jgi:NYN domain